MVNQFTRTELIIGIKSVQKLQKSTVAVFGIGGVGSYVVEALARAGIGNFILIDNDDVDVTNINRQIIATHKTIGVPKVEVAKNRILEINSNAKINIRQEFFMPSSEDFFNEKIDYVVDCVDTVTAKVEIIKRAKEHNIPIISCMGTGNKLDPTKFEVSDIFNTSICPLAKVMRKELRKIGIKDLKVVYSKEEPINLNQIERLKETNSETGINDVDEDKKYISHKPIPGSISFVPSVAGLIIAGEVIKDIIKITSQSEVKIN